ncbi:MAG: hypothetical protein OHK006_13180 [Thermodesulfovibrionales bacterium]
MITPEQIEDAAVEALRSAMPYCGAVETYAGQLEGEIEQLPITYPSLFLFYGGSVFEWVDEKTHNETATLSVMVCAKNLRSREASRKDPKGAYRLIKETLLALTNKTLGLDMERLRPVRVSLIFAKKGIAIYGIDFQASFDNTYEGGE